MPQLTDCRIDPVVRVEMNALAPKPGRDRFAVHQLIPPFHQQQEKLHRQPLQPDGASLAAQLEAGRIQFIIPKTK